jgi:hypothetical protein
MATPSRPPGTGPTAAELQVARDVISRAKAADSRLRNADELLVCAALALRAGEFGGVPTRAAEGMGKVGSKAKHVRDWVARIELLEQASESASGVNSNGLLVHQQWISKETPGIQQLEVDPLLLSVGKRHGKRKLHAQTTTPGGSTCEASATVDYTLPPAEGERESAAKRRTDRHRQREERKLRSLDFTGAAAIDEPPFGLSVELLASPEWITQNTQSLVEGSFDAGALFRVDERAEALKALEGELADVIGSQGTPPYPLRPPHYPILLLWQASSLTGSVASLRRRLSSSTRATRRSSVCNASSVDVAISA